MGMVVRTNQMALSANNSLNSASKTVNGSLQKLASGFKINKAADDASGLSISEKMKAQIKALDTATDNCEDGANMIQTAEGYMAETHDMLNRMVELAEKSANGVLEDTDRDALQEEMDQLCGEIDRIASTANFNGQKLLDGSQGSKEQLTIKVSNGKIEYTAPTSGSSKANDVSGGKIAENADLIDGVTYKVSTAPAAGTAGTFDAAAIKVKSSNKDGTAGAVELDASVKAQKGDTVTIDGSGDGTSANGMIFAGCVGSKGATFTFNGTDWKTEGGTGTALDATGTMKAGIAHNENFEYDEVAAKAQTTGTDKNGIDLQIGESSVAADRLKVSINSFHTDSLFKGLNGFQNTTNDATETDANAAVKVKMSNDSSTYDDAVSIDITDKDAASAAADALRQVTNYVSDERGKLGAQQNRLEHTVNNLTTASENVTAANSRIRDTDMADEMIKYTQNNVVTQAAQAMLAQANTQPQNVLSLLQ